MSTPTFTVSNGIGRYQFSQVKAPAQAPAARCDAVVEQSAHDVVKQQNAQLAQLKDQYMKLHVQLHQEEKECSMKLLNLQRELRAEQKRVEELEAEIGNLTRCQNDQGIGIGSSAVLERIWSVLQTYRERIRRMPQVQVKQDPRRARASGKGLSVVKEDESESHFSSVMRSTPTSRKRY